MERAAREVLREFLEPGEESVGNDVNVQHLGGAPLGATVRGIAKVTAIDNRRVSFDVEAWVGDRQIGSGKHSRAMVLVSRLVENLAKLSKTEEYAMNLHANTLACCTIWYARDNIGMAAWLWCRTIDGVGWQVESLGTLPHG